MKYLIIFFILMMQITVQAASINAAADRTMQTQALRNNYNRQVNYKPMPYWQMQSNYSTRNRIDYSTYTNSVNQYQYNTQIQRGRYR